MTLLVAARARDCIVALSDRRETVSGGPCGEVTKCHLDAAGGYCIALAGDGTAAGRILNNPRGSHIPRVGIFREIERLAAVAYAAPDTKSMAGHMIVSDGGGFRMYDVLVTSGSAEFFRSDENMRVEGDRGAIAICKDLAQDLAIADMSCEAAAKCLHTLAARVAKTVDGVGGRGKCGIDMVVFAGAGTVKQIPRCTDKMGTIRVSFVEFGRGRPRGQNEVGAA